MTETSGRLGALASDDPEQVAAAVAAIRALPDALQGPPPAALIAALLHLGRRPQTPLYELARDWERGALGEALWDAFQAAATPGEREQAAWLLKQLASPSRWQEIADVAASSAEPLQVRIFLLQALDWLAFGGGPGWAELRPWIDRAWHDESPAIRECALGIVMSLPHSDEAEPLVREALDDPEPTVVLTALNAVAQGLVEVERSVLERLTQSTHQSIRDRARGLLAYDR
jgi:hypothetical protein